MNETMNESVNETVNETVLQSPPQAVSSPPRVQTYSPALSAPGIIDPRRKSPILAGLLSLMPGLGQVYIGYYLRGFVNIIVIGSIISLFAGDVVQRGGIPLFAMFMVFFWLYNIVDAARKASIVNLALDGVGTMDLPQDFPTPGLRGSIVAGALLIVVGSVFLANTLFGISLDWLEDWWPAAPILLGVYLLGRGLVERSKSSS